MTALPAHGLMGNNLGTNRSSSNNPNSLLLAHGTQPAPLQSREADTRSSLYQNSSQKKLPAEQEGTTQRVSERENCFYGSGNSGYNGYNNSGYNNNTQPSQAASKKINTFAQSNDWKDCFKIARNVNKVDPQQAAKYARSKTLLKKDNATTRYQLK